MLMPFKTAIARFALIAFATASLLSTGDIAPASAQDEAGAPTVALPTQRRDGERFVIETSHVKERIDGETVMHSMRQNTVAVATVGSVAANGYVLDIDTRDYDMSGGDIFPAPFVERLAEMQKQMPVKLRMSPEGAVAGLANGPDVIAFAERAMAEVQAHLTSLDMPESAKPVVRQVVTQLSDPAYLEQSILQSPRLYFFMSGAELELDATYYIDDTIVFPLFTRPLPSRIYFGIRDVDMEAGTVTYDWWQEPDQEIFQQELVDFVLRLAAQAGREPPGPDEIDFSGFVYSAEANLTYDLKSGLPLSMVFVKTIEIQGKRNVETVEARTLFE